MPPKYTINLGLTKCPMPAQEPDVRNKNYQEVALGYTPEMAVEEAKRCLLTLETSGFNIDSIYSECGFRSRSTFFMVFKKIEGKSPAAWLEQIRQCG